MHRCLSLPLAALTALVVSATAFGYTPKPHQYALQAALGRVPACVNVGQVLTIPIIETNLGKTTVTAKASTVPVGNNPFMFGLVSAKPAAKRTTTRYTDQLGAPHSYSVLSWQRRLAPGKSATFSVTVKVPDWNVATPPYTDPTTGQVHTPPPPLPYPISFTFFSEIVGDPGAGQYLGQQFTYCGQPLPPLVPGK